MHTHREVHHGPVYRLLHSGGAGGVFLGVLVHVVRGVLQGAYTYVSSVLAVGTVVYGVLVGVAFLGYVLPWGTMSYWGPLSLPTCILVSPVWYPGSWGAIPWVGPVYPGTSWYTL